MKITTRNTCAPGEGSGGGGAAMVRPWAPAIAMPPLPALLPATGLDIATPPGPTWGDFRHSARIWFLKKCLLTLTVPITVATATPPRPTKADPEYRWECLDKTIKRTVSAGLCHPSVPCNSRCLGLNPRLWRESLPLLKKKRHFLAQLYFPEDFQCTLQTKWPYPQNGQPGCLDAAPMLQRGVHPPLLLPPHILNQAAQVQPHRQHRRVVHWCKTRPASGLPNCQPVHFHPSSPSLLHFPFRPHPFPWETSFGQPEAKYAVNFVTTLKSFLLISCIAN